MKTIAHISDLHFGTVHPDLADGLAHSLNVLRPDLIIISGDLTQRATSREFQAAQRYLKELPFPIIAVPGNHDISAYNLLQRIFFPFQKFQQYIANVFSTAFTDQELTVLGINTTRRFPWVNGRVSYDQMEQIRQYFCRLPDEQWKILVTHHPFLAPPDFPGRSLVGRADKTLQTVRECRLDLLLAGHFHMSYATGTHAVYTAINPSVLVVQAGTALSSRTRGEQNAYNVMTLRQDHVLDVAVWMWKNTRFHEHRVDRYARQDGKWLQQLPNQKLNREV